MVNGKECAVREAIYAPWHSTEAHGVPSTYALLQNFPNPFNPATEIRYQVPRVSRVHLVVYDILGREVTTLIDENKSAGVHQVQFDTGGLPSGVYMCHMTAGNFADIRKLLLLR